MNSEPLLFTNPSSGEIFGKINSTPVADVNTVVEELRTAFPEWSKKSINDRIRILKKFQAVLLDSRDEITSVINLDCGKSRQDALIELFVSLDMLSQYLRKANSWLKPKKVSSGLYVLKTAIVEHKPHGVVCVISPWNYPLTLSLPPMLVALLAGNTVILKPSEVTGAVGALMEKLIKRVPELSPYVRVVHGDGAVGAAVIQARPDFIFMTGSTATGKKIMAMAAESLTPVALELGGKDAMIVLEDADLEKAARWGTWGAFFNTGQTCMAVERVYVVGAHYEKFVEISVEQANKFKSGFTTELNSDFSMGPVTDPRQVRIIDRHIEDALSKGAKILTGGKLVGAFYEPIVMVDVNHTMLVMQEETFGPIMPIMRVNDEAEAIRLANDSRFGLGASVWSSDPNHAKQVANHLNASSIIINDCIAQFGIPMLPFGGVKDSGFGRIHGQEGLMQFTRPYSYAVGQPPLKWDIATILREKGKYALGSLLMGILFGTSFKQRWDTISGFFNNSEEKAVEKNVPNPATSD